METKKSYNGTKLADQGFKLLFMMNAKRLFRGKEIYLRCEQVLLGRDISIKPRVSSINR